MAHGNSSGPRFNENPLDILDWDEFDYITPGIDSLGPNSFLPNTPNTVLALQRLGRTMTVDPLAVSIENRLGDVDSNIPAPYTYLAQFIDHDITLTVKSTDFDPDKQIGQPDFQPLDQNQARSTLRNKRTGSFDLDCLYGLQVDPSEPELAIPFTGDKFDIGRVDSAGNRPPFKDEFNDLPRTISSQPEKHKRARIGDPRNDENVIVAQMHLAFLKFHNAVVDDGFTFDDARRLVTHHYQWVVLQDFLPRICNPQTINDVIVKGNRLYKPRGTEKFMPFEFNVAAYRFGHSLVRSTYDFNLNFLKQGGLQAEGTLAFMFQFSRVSGDLGGHDTLPENWIVEWERLFMDRTMQIDPTLTHFLAKLPNQNDPKDIFEVLAIRNLLKGYLFGLPTGQAMAQLLLPENDRLTTSELEQACRPKVAGEAEGQWEVLQQTGFHDQTPLWFYLLAEAKIKGGGNRLGPLGSLIVCETIIGLMRANPDSILNTSFIPTLGSSPGMFDLQDLLLKAGVLPERIAGI
ncbi:hypothetical protein EI534_07590 [Pseudomonas frederiksbergensis]|nr:hypothetical protein [Pseudomonas frederiksbergensis]